LDAETIDINVIRQYLLGQALDADRAEVEERLMADDRIYDDLLAIEDELIDEYLGGQLSQVEQQKFEEVFLAAPSRREKLRFARLFRHYIGGEEVTSSESVKSSPAPVKATNPSIKSKSSFFQFRNPILAFSVVVLMVLMLGLFAWQFNRKPITQNQVMAVSLSPGLTRDSQDTNHLKLTVGVTTVQFQLMLLNSVEFPSYTADLLDPEGNTLASPSSTLKQSVNGNEAVVVEVSATLLHPGEYRLKLSGRSAAGVKSDLETYSFRVMK